MQASLDVLSWRRKIRHPREPAAQAGRSRKYAATSVPADRAAERGDVFEWPKDRKPIFMKMKSAGPG
jgi:hypothetical protein